MEILNHLRNEVGKWIKLGLHLHHKPQDNKISSSCT